MTSLDNARASMEKHQIALCFLAVISGFIVALFVSGTERLEVIIHQALGLMLFVTQTLVELIAMLVYIPVLQRVLPR